MYVHAGEDVMIRSSKIIAIIERETVESSLEIQSFLDRKKEWLTNLTNDDYKSLIITDPHIYLSPIAPATLKRRLLTLKDYELNL
ncbi:extracellular matrix regulator RemB [Bacillus niameyensis]|uniref:extracellular matrix regulator RemB n=1 Tax=Bacillus niameyensis TaxID=1522308 RepID=UPI00078647C2|nr:extracellular matrix/biofilm biosynthesis regulator RemA family protein [Bacillus niameyensis]